MSDQGARLVFIPMRRSRLYRRAAGRVPGFTRDHTYSELPVLIYR
jgi:hypothetical protein